MGFKRITACMMAGLLAIMVSACTTTGNNFNSTAVTRFVVGETTVSQARDLLQADPFIVYPQSDGTSLVRWAYMASLSTDALYFNRELWVLFGPDGRFVRVVKNSL